MDVHVERHRRKCHPMRQWRGPRRPRRPCSYTPMTWTTTSSTLMFMYANDVDQDVLDAHVHVRQWRGLRQGRWRKRPDATSTAFRTYMGGGEGEISLTSNSRTIKRNARIDHISKGMGSLTLKGRTIKTQSLTSNSRGLEGREEKRGGRG